MAVRDMVPFRKHTSSPREFGALAPLRDEMNRVFDEFFSGFGLAPRRQWDEGPAAFSPRIDVSETPTELRVSAELPGMEQKDVDLAIDNDVLCISGEKKEEREEKGENWHRTELAYGEFHRVVPLPATVVSDKGSAKFRKGVLTVTLPKREIETATRKRIAIKVE